MSLYTPEEMSSAQRLIDMNKAFKADAIRRAEAQQVVEPEESSVLTSAKREQEDGTPVPDSNGCFASPADGAKFMASFGIPQVPLSGKNPAINGKGWQMKASTDFKQIDAWAKQFPGCNFGSLAQAKIGGFYVLETDSADLAEKYSRETGSDLFASLVIRSSAPGRNHRYYRQSAESLADLRNIGQDDAAGYSLRFNNEQCVSPGSIHKSGVQYAVVYGNVPDVQPSEEIAWLKAQIKSKKPESKKYQPPVPGEKITECRNNRVHEYAFHRWTADSVTAEQLRQDVYAFNKEYCSPPLDDSELDATVIPSVQKFRQRKDETVLLIGGVPVGTAKPAAATRKISGQCTIEEYRACVNISALSPDEDEDKNIVIPPFDNSTMAGLAKEMAEFVTSGTTMPPQFAYGIAKTFIGARMASSGTRMDQVSAEPRRQFAAVGESGTGKGESFRRIRSIMQPQGCTDGCLVKIIDSADSGAGLKDFFFETPDYPVLMYIDEIESLGHKASEGRNPDILDMILELADGTVVNRVLANDSRGKSRSKRKENARLVTVICGQNGTVYGKAFGSRAKQGIFDRLTPEHAEPVEIRDCPPPLDPVRSYELLAKFNALPFGRDMTMEPRAKRLLDDFWDIQDPKVKKTARFRKNLFVDAYVNAIGRGSLVVTPMDALRATKAMSREMIIRAAHFNTPIADRVSYWMSVIKRITRDMREQLADGRDPELVALSERDYRTKSNAYRDNEEHIFQLAWRVHAPVHLVKVLVTKSNGHSYEKYLPAPQED